MTAPKYQNRPSDIHGTGLFSLSRIGAGTDLSTDPEFLASLMDSNGGVGLNHSCDPNLLNDWPQAITLRDISPDEELTVSYGTYAPSNGGCNCDPCKGKR